MNEQADPATYVVDHLEDNGWVVLEDEQGHTFNLPRFWLPSELAEGDVVVVEQQELISEDGLDSQLGYRGLDIYVDTDATKARKERAKDRRDRLPKGPEGDLSL